MSEKTHKNTVVIASKTVNGVEDFTIEHYGKNGKPDHTTWADSKEEAISKGKNMQKFHAYCSGLKVKLVLNYRGWEIVEEKGKVLASVEGATCGPYKDFQQAMDAIYTPAN